MAAAFLLLLSAASAALVYAPLRSVALLASCSGAANCGAGLYCGSCPAAGSAQPSCIRGQAVQPSAVVGGGLPFNKYSWLVTHNSFSIVNEPSSTGAQRITFYNQDDSVTNQLRNGVRGLMLDMYDFEGDIWLCHSFQGQCYNFTAFEPAINTLKEVEAFLSENPTEIVTIIIEDYVHVLNGLTTLFTNAGLRKYWYPVAEMPVSGKDWPTVTDMVAKNRRLLVFTSVATKEADEGIAYQWRYMVENERYFLNPVFQYSEGVNNDREVMDGIRTVIQRMEPDIDRQMMALQEMERFRMKLGEFGSRIAQHAVKTNITPAGDPGIIPGSCPNRKESQPLNSRYASLFLQNYFPSIPVENDACKENSMGLPVMVDACYKAAGNTMPNFLAVNFYMRSSGGGVFDVQDRINGLALCGCSTITACQVGAPFGVCKNGVSSNQTPAVTAGTYSGYVQLSGSARSFQPSELLVSRVLHILLMIYLLL